MIQLAFDFCQRWRDGRDRYVPAGPVIEPKHYHVEPIGFTPAKAFVVRHHYSGSMPAARQQIGLYSKSSEHRPAELVGVAVFSVPMQAAVVPRYLGVAANDGVELGRLVLLDSVAGNGESWFVSRALRLLRASHPQLRGVVSYCDPVERLRDDGTILKPGHFGVIYQALSARYFGRASPRTLYLGNDGRVLSPRTLSKAANNEQGAGYALRQIALLTGEDRHDHEDATHYLARVLPRLRRLRHPGNLVFGFALGSARERRCVRNGMAVGHDYILVQMVLLSATLGNGPELSDWLAGTFHRTHDRPVPLVWETQLSRRLDSVPPSS